MNPFTPPLIYPFLLFSLLLFQFIVVKPQFIPHAPWPVRLFLWVLTVFLLYNIIYLAAPLLAANAS